ncbi:MAG: ABC transporter ATP-binding protein [Alphaproteobacteria bacterium]|nr:ABC transporter ATP-binding protein [Alphaproteobacteria bacterium]
MAPPLLRLDGVSRRFGNTRAADRVSFTVAAGEMFSILGPSGCGKSTLLRLIAGFETPDAGAILLNGEDLVAVPPHRRPVNMMFQSYALFPHLSVADNVGFGLRRQGRPAAEVARRVGELLALVRLEEFGPRRVQQLSGGERQRVALARALARAPKLLLLDEPLGALDRQLRAATQLELTALQRSLGLTLLVVTHDQEEAMAHSARLAIMRQGRIEQVGTPAEVYRRPASRFVAEFVGEATLLTGRLVAAAGGQLAVAVDGLPRPVQVVGDAALAVGTAVTVMLRPEALSLRAASADNAVAGSVVDIAYTGSHSLYRVRTAAGLVLKVAETHGGEAAETPVALGAAVTVAWPAAAGVVLGA